MTLVSNAIKSEFKKAGSKADRLVCAMPVNMKFPSKRLEDVKIMNNISSAKSYLYLYDSIDDVTKMQKNLKNTINF
jgi:hypothetical protein